MKWLQWREFLFWDDILVAVAVVVTQESLSHDDGNDDGDDNENSRYCNTFVTISTFLIGCGSYSKMTLAGTMLNLEEKVEI